MSARRGALLTWGLPAMLVVAISIALTQGSGGFSPGAQPARFSGSSVVLAMPAVLPPARLAAGTRVTLVRDAAAAEFYPSPATLDSVVRAWRDALAAVGASVRIVPSDRVLNETASDVLVVPASPCLTVATREAIERAGTRGQGLIVTGAPGTHDAGCRTIGYGLLVALTGASRVAVLEGRSIVYVTVPYGSPLSVGIPPGARLDVRPASQIALRGSARDAVYSSYDLRPVPAEESPLLDGALTHSEYRGARVVHWGFELRDVVGRPWNDGLLQLLVRNSVAWAAGVPLPEVEPWPEGRQAAVLLAQDVEEGFTNAGMAADSLRAAGVTGTFFVTSGGVDRYQRIVRSLEEAGEVASHAEDRRLLGGTPVGEQDERLRATQRDLTGLIGRLVSGLRPPQEQFDQATMVAWLDAGGEYLFGPNGARSVAPELLALATDTLVLIPRTADDDITVLAGSAGNARVAEGWFSDDLAHVRALGGVYTLSYHSHLLSSRRHVPILARFARGLAEDSTVWIATGAQIASWWRARASVHARLEGAGRDALSLTVENRGWRPLVGAVVRVTLQKARRATSADAELLPADPGVARVPLPPLAPAEALTVTLRLAAADD